MYILISFSVLSYVLYRESTQKHKQGKTTKGFKTEKLVARVA